MSTTPGSSANDTNNGLRTANMGGGPLSGGGIPPQGGGAAGAGGAGGPNGGGGGATLQLTGGAAIVAPVAAFQGGLPANALVVVPLSAPTDELKEQLSKGPLAVTPDQMWKLLGFNGPAVQVQDDQGRPIAIGLEDLLAGLRKQWDDSPDNLDLGRILAQELVKYAKFEEAEGVLSKIVARGGTPEDWLRLGLAQLEQKKVEKAEGTLRGAQNLMPDHPLPLLNLARVAQLKGDKAKERELIEQAISLQPGSVDAWLALFNSVRAADGEDAAVSAIETLAAKPELTKTAAPFIAIQFFYANNEATRDKALVWAEKAVESFPNDSLALRGLSALYGQAGEIDKVISLLQPHEATMMRDVGLANNYFQALFQSRQLDKVTRLLNSLAGSPNREVKQFAIEQSRAVAQFLQQQQAQLAQAGQQKI